jgi:hypothetical protein
MHKQKHLFFHKEIILIPSLRTSEQPNFRLKRKVSNRAKKKRKEQWEIDHLGWLENPQRGKYVRPLSPPFPSSMLFSKELVGGEARLSATGPLRDPNQCARDARWVSLGPMEARHRNHQSKNRQKKETKRKGKQIIRRDE